MVILGLTYDDLKRSKQGNMTFKALWLLYNYRNSYNENSTMALSLRFELIAFRSNLNIN